MQVIQFCIYVMILGGWVDLGAQLLDGWFGRASQWSGLVLRSRVVHFIPQKVCSTVKRSHVERKPSTRSTNLNVAGKSTADRSCCGCGCEVGAAKVATCSRLPSANFPQGSLHSFDRIV